MSQIWLIPAFPLLGAILNGFFGKFFGKRFVTILAPLTIGMSFVQSLMLFLVMRGTPGKSLNDTVYTWMSTGSFQVDIAFQIDQLSGLFLLIITGVGFLIHVYSVGYMYEEESYYRYFSYLNLFIFFMLILVLGDSFLLMFVGWEGVGLCSYLLIGYYFEKKSAAEAAKKAFLFNRIGDFGFLSAVLLIFLTFGSLNFDFVNNNAASYLQSGGALVTAITLFLFLGAVGKSAQIPLYVWLPDAMEGPTPVSALIHAATMVTSGLYMIARLSNVFVLAPFTMNLIAIVGALTALMAATIAVTQTDIKKVLAYSTVSQLGYMFLAMGVGAFSAGIFHVMTHAFFKALLFLGSGSVIHAMHHEQDMLKMGGLKKKLPITHATMLIGTLAISGIPFLSGFFSKDEILWKAFSSGGFLLWFVGFVTAGLTSFYMFRMMYLTFYGESRVEAHTEAHLHESPSSMLFPLVLLAIFSALAGLLGVPHVLGFLPNGMELYFHGFFAEVPVGSGNSVIEVILMVLSVLLALGGWQLAHDLYGKNLDKVTAMKQEFSKLHAFSFNKWYVDEFYDDAIIQRGKRASRDILWKDVDQNLLDRLVMLSSELAHFAGGSLRNVQTGVLQHYAVVFSAGVLFIVLYVFA